MNSINARTNRYGFRAVGISLTLLTLASTPVRGENADVVLEWNRIVQRAATGPNWRAYAMVHIAMFDAVNSVADVFERHGLALCAAFLVSTQFILAAVCR